MNYFIGSGIDWKDNHECSDYALINGKLYIFELFLKAGFHADKKYLNRACSAGNFEMVKLLIEYTADPQEDYAQYCKLLSEFQFDSHLRDEERIAEILEYFFRLGIDIGSVQIVRK